MDNKKVPHGFNNRLRELELSADDIAAELGISPRAVSYWMAGQRQPRLSFRQTRVLMRKLKCNIAQLDQYFESEVLAA